MIWLFTASLYCSYNEKEIVKSHRASKFPQKYTLSPGPMRITCRKGNGHLGTRSSFGPARHTLAGAVLTPATEPIAVGGRVESGIGIERSVAIENVFPFPKGYMIK